MSLPQLSVKQFFTLEWQGLMPLFLNSIELTLIVAVLILVGFFTHNAQNLLDSAANVVMCCAETRMAANS